MFSPRRTMTRHNRRSQSIKRRAPQFEYLEARRVLATVTLNTDTNSPGELRTAIANALPGEIIEFNLPAGMETIVLFGAGPRSELVIDKALTINGDNALGSGVNVTISGDNKVQVMNVDDGDANTYAAVFLSNLTITGGNAAQGGGIQNSEVLTLTNTTVSGNTATDGTGGGINSVGYGSALSILDGSTVDGNYAYGTGAGNRQGYYVSPATGGGVFVSLGKLTISGSTISSNTATGPAGTDMAGGGIAISSFLAPDYTQSAALDVTITNTVISGNVVVGEQDSMPPYNGVDPYGGGLYATGFGQVTVSDSTISGNSAVGIGSNYAWGGGAAFFARGSDALNIDIIDDTQITSNYATSGGGFVATHSYYYDSNLQINVANSTIANNQASYWGGGTLSRGRYAEPGSFVTTITNSTVSNNTAGASGGSTVWNADLIFENSTVSGNTTTGAGSFDYGGGISGYGVYLYSYYLAGRSNNELPLIVVRNTTVTGNSTGGFGGGIYGFSADLELIQSTISGNTAGAEGGGIHIKTYYSLAYSGSTTIDRSTITLNRSDGLYGGGGIYVDYSHDQFTMSNTIVSGNIATTNAVDIYDYSSSGLVSANTSFSLIGDGSGGAYSTAFPEANPGPDPNGNIVGGSVGGPVDALLGALADNGGPTLTHLPEMASPAVDAGDPAVIPGTATDQRGFERVVDGDMMGGPRMDMGSVELGDPPPTGDFTGPAGVPDGVWDCLDLIALSQEIAAGSNSAAFDMNRDGVVDVGDVRDGAGTAAIPGSGSGWLAIGGAFAGFTTTGFLEGDADLDGVVDGLDFIEWNTTKFTNQTDGPCVGDFNLDSVVDGLDFIIWNANKFTSAQSQPGSLTVNVNGWDFIKWNENKFKDSKMDPGAPNITLGGTLPESDVRGDQAPRVVQPVDRLAQNSKLVSHKVEPTSTEVRRTAEQVEISSLDRLFAELGD